MSNYDNFCVLRLLFYPWGRYVLRWIITDVIMFNWLFKSHKPVYKTSAGMLNFVADDVFKIFFSNLLSIWPRDEMGWGQQNMHYLDAMQFTKNPVLFRFSINNN